MLAVLLVAATPWIAHSAPVISSINVTPLPLSPGSNFTIVVQATDVTAGTVVVDLRPAAAAILRPPLTLSGGSWKATGTVPANLILAADSTASVQVIMTKGTSRATRTIKVPFVNAANLFITSPANLFLINQNSVVVSGTAGGTTTAVTVNGVAASLSAGRFSATVPLREGNNVITAVGLTAEGQTPTASIQVTVDTTPPRLTIDSPRDGAVLSDPFATVTGIINDTVVGTINGEQASVNVNGIAAPVANRTYVAMNVPLVPGANTITSIGRDLAGNSRTVSINVIYNTAVTARIKAVSGDGQTAPIGQLLAQPLVVRAIDDAGNPAPNKKVIFKVTQNDGTVTSGADTARSLIVMSGPDGLA